MSAPAASARAVVGPVRLPDLLGAELTKIRTLPATWIALGVALAANTLLGTLAATDVVRIAGPGGPTPIAQLGSLMLAPAYVCIAVAVFAAGSEFSGGQVRVSLLAVPDRDRLFAAKLMVTATVSAPAAVVALVPGYLVQHAAAVADGTLGIGAAWADLAALVVAYLLLGLIGYGFAFIARTVVTPLAVLFIAAILVAPTLRGAFPDLVTYLPHDATLSLVNLAADPAALGRIGGLLVLTAWAGGSVGAAWVIFAKRDS
jgi:ABC-2 type transport system permease protein